ncbi:MAG: ATP-binding protein [Pyrinomonadaceae bacterium]
MQRRILIIDDYDDLASSLSDVFDAGGHNVEIVTSRADAMRVDDLDDFDLVITDLDVDNRVPEVTAYANGNIGTCLPAFPDKTEFEHVKAFKFCAAHFRRDEFDENELKNFIETVLSFKNQFVDNAELVRHIHEKIEFELPSAISPMHSILDYLIQRVEKLGGVSPSGSNLFVALDEAFVNAVKHGNKFNANKLVRISAELSPKEAIFTVEDEGEGFDVNAIPDPLDPENLFKTSGRGVLFIYNIMDEVKYNERGNRLTMVKKCETREPAV